MNNLHADALLSQMFRRAKKFSLKMASGPKLALAFTVTLILFIVGTVALYVVLPIILLLLGGMLLLNWSKDIPMIKHVVNKSQSRQKELEAVYLQTICAELIQKMAGMNEQWSFDRVESHMAGEGTDIETVIEACLALEWLKINFESRYVTLTSKGIVESREYLEWTGKETF